MRGNETEDIHGEVARVTVIGAGTMGHGIAEVSALAGMQVWLVDVDQSVLDRAMSRVSASLDKLAASGRVAADQVGAALARIRPLTELTAAIADADVVIEAVPELLDVKCDVLRRAADAMPRHAVLMTNTSQFSVTALAAATERPQDVIGAHFFNPPVLMKLVEVSRGTRTSERTLDVALEYVRRIGKEAAVCRRDAVGMITSRALAALRAECIRIHDEGIASIEDIDRAIRLGLNHPMGPFELNDYNGLDVGLAVLEALRIAYGERFTPPQSLINRVRAGMLGRKSGAGWYDHSKAPPRPID